MTKLIDGKAIALKVENDLKIKIAQVKGRNPGLAFIRVGDLAASKIYIEMKKKKCMDVGILSFDKELPNETTEDALIDVIKSLNLNPLVDGILVQLPLPEHINTSRVIEAIDPKKDVDGFHPENLGKLLMGNLSGFIPCTPLGIHRMLIDSNIPIKGKHVVIVGRSNIVGKPLGALLMQKDKNCNATVTIAHSQSENLIEICRSADILIAAIGKSRFITKDMVKQGASVIDVGINRIQSEDGKSIITGDVDFDNVFSKCGYITPVPGGVGPMTIASLLCNTWLSFQKNQSNL